MSNTKVKLVESQKKLTEYLDLYEKRINDTLPKNVSSAKRFISLLLKSAGENPVFEKCSLSSVLGAFFTSIELGLEPNSPMGYAYLIPYYSKKLRLYELSFQVGYRGLVELAYRSERVISIDSEPVYKQDKFEFRKGTKPYLNHVPDLKKEHKDEDIFAVYAIATTKQGATVFEVMNKKDIELIRIRSAKKSTGEFSPWKNWWTEMAKKTVVKRLMKYLPLSSDMALAHTVDGKSEAGEAVYFDEKKKEVSNVMEGEALENNGKTIVNNNVINSILNDIDNLDTKDKSKIEEVEKHIDRTEKSGILDKKDINKLRNKFKRKLGKGGKK